MKNFKLLLFVFAAFIFNFQIVAAQTTYYNYSSTYEIEREYSYSTLFMSKDSEIKVIKNAGTVDTQESSGNYKLYRTNIKTNDELIILITKSAVNKNGELLDAVVKINNVEQFASVEDGFVTFGIKSSYNVANSVSDPSSAKTITPKENEPIVFELGTSKAKANLNVTYYITGTYKNESEGGKLGGITAASGTIWDFDNLASTVGGSYTTDLFNGDEGIVPTSGDANIYYNKSKIHKNSGYSYEYKEQDSGIAIRSKTGGDINNLCYENSIFLKNSRLSNSTFKLTFSGAGSNLYFVFASPYPYNLDNPINSFDTKEVTAGDQINYVITQYIPNNYYGTTFAFQGAYDMMYSNTRYKTFRFTETFDKNLEFDLKKLKVVNELGEDVTEYFTSTFEDSLLTIEAKESSFGVSTFYGHAYKISLPVKIKEDIKDVDKIIVGAKELRVVSTRCKQDLNCPKEERFTTASAEVRIKYTVTVNYYEKDTDNKLADSKKLTYFLNDEYKTDYNGIDNSWSLVETPSNASGVVNGNIVVNYYFTPVIIENPPTGMIVLPIFAMIALLGGAIVIYKQHKKKIFNV